MGDPHRHLDGGIELHDAQVSGGATHTCALATSGEMWCWGTNAFGELGVGDTNPRLSPVLVAGGGTWASSSTNFDHTCAVTSTGSLWCWGSNDHGQLGIGAATGAPYTTAQPVAVGSVWSSVATGGEHTCAVRVDGSLWCWGHGSFGELGQGDAAQHTTPIQVGTATNWTETSAGQDHTCAVNSADELWCWGRSTKGQVGNSQAGVNVRLPARVGAWLDWSHVAVGDRHSCAATTTNRLYCWGFGVEGQLGTHPSGEYFSSPARVGTGSSWVRPGVGGRHSCAFTVSGQVYCFGEGIFGQLGDGTLTPSRVEPRPLSTAWTSLAGGAAHSCRIGFDTSMWCWGSDDHGQLGNDSATGNSDVPVRVLDYAGWASVAAGGSTTCGIETNHRLRCWEPAASVRSATASQLTGTSRPSSARAWRGRPSTRPAPTPAA